MDGHPIRTRLRLILQALQASKWALLAGAVTSALMAFWWKSESRASKKRIKAGMSLKLLDIRVTLLIISSAATSDPSLLRRHTTYESFTTPSGFTYPRIRTFYKEHQQASKLPRDLPLLVFMHGLGGSASQFEPLLTSLINSAPCLAIDLPGCGLSDFAPDDRKAYTTHALAELLATAIGRYRDTQNSQKVVLIGHSLGCSITVLLASSSSPLAHLLDGLVVGIVSICPSAKSPTKREAATMHRLGRIPILLFDLFRWYDRRGGLYSRSVERMVGSAADEKTRKLQLKYNEQSQSAVFLRMVGEGIGRTGLPGKEIWTGVKVPLFLIAGEADTLTPPAEVERIIEWLTDSSIHNGPDHQDMGEQKKSPVPSTAGDAVAAQNHIQRIDADLETPRTDSGTVIKDEHTATKHAFALKTTIFPQPSGHGLMYATSTVRILSGMIENFLSNHIDQRLGASWQLQHLTTTGKWDVKNLKKWQAVEACSVPIGGLFRAMKTMREVDDVHCPKEFVKHFSHSVLSDGVGIVIDISHESPVYHPKGLEDAGVEYHKFPTVSKEKPKAEEVERFNAIVDKIRESHGNIPPATIGVHCHYGFNRTGFFIVCYLVERMGYRLQDALEEFAQKREPGIRHSHFENELFVRYAVKMERRGTVVSS